MVDGSDLEARDNPTPERPSSSLLRPSLGQQYSPRHMLGSLDPDSERCVRVWGLPNLLERQLEVDRVFGVEEILEVLPVESERAKPRNHVKEDRY